MRSIPVGAICPLIGRLGVPPTLLMCPPQTTAKVAKVVAPPVSALLRVALGRAPEVKPRATKVVAIKARKRATVMGASMDMCLQPLSFLRCTHALWLVLVRAVALMSSRYLRVLEGSKRELTLVGSLDLLACCQLPVIRLVTGVR